jgi:hypothetical protein
MRFYLTIDLENEAFADGNSGSEIARLLRLTATHVEELDLWDRPSAIYLHDINGNRVGDAVVNP